MFTSLCTLECNGAAVTKKKMTSSTTPTRTWLECKAVFIQPYQLASPHFQHPHLYLFLHVLYFHLSCFPQGDFDRGVKDCDDALEVCKESHTALYRKALCLKALGKYKEAYNCITDCLLITRVVREGETPTK